jgi:hypothetical protein
MSNEEFRNYPPELENEFTLFCLQHWCYLEKKRLPNVFAKVLYAYYGRTYEYKFPYTFFDYVTKNQKIILEDFYFYANPPFNLSINEHSKRKFSTSEIDKFCVSKFATQNGSIDRIEEKLTLLRQKVEPIKNATQELWNSRHPYFKLMTPEEKKQFSIELETISLPADEIVNQKPLDIFVNENLIPFDTETVNSPLYECEYTLECIKFNEMILLSRNSNRH